MTTPILYGMTASRASRNVWLFEELAVPYQRILQSYKNQATHTPEYLAINPNGHIPALVDGDTVMWESLAINLYLAKKYPSSLSPQNLAEEGECLKWSFWAVSEIEKDALTILMHMAALPFEMRKPELAKQALGSLARPFAVLNAHLEKNTLMLGDRFTVLDINLAAICAWVRPAKELLDAHPALARWLHSCLDRTAYKTIQGYNKAESAAA